MKVLNGHRLSVFGAALFDRLAVHLDQRTGILRLRLGDD